jgi:hypothetical protein
MVHATDQGQGRVKALLLLAAACSLTPELIRAYQCQVACRAKGWDNGSYASGYCVCLDYVRFEELVLTPVVPVPVPRFNVIQEVPE